MKVLCLILISFSALAQLPASDLKSYSDKLNKELPEVLDHATKLIRTTVENNQIYYHFLLKASNEEYAWALPKVKSQVLKTICHQGREKIILKNFKANLIYKYENEKGQALGEFMIRPSHCAR